MNQITPYTRAVRRYAPYTPQYRTAAAGVRAARFAYDNREAIGNAAKRIGKWYKSKRQSKRARFDRTRVGDEPGQDNCKTNLIRNNGLVNKDTRTLYSTELTEIELGTAQGQRERNLINVRGFKICAEFKCLSTEPLYINMAVLTVRNGQTLDATDFFRAPQSLGERAVDFSTIRTGLEMHCYPINTDKYHVWKHMRTQLVPGNSPTTTVSLEGYSYHTVDFFIKFGRQLRYQNNTTPTSGNTFFVYWADRFGAAGGSAVQVTDYAVSEKLITYFRETCC